MPPSMLILLNENFWADPKEIESIVGTNNDRTVKFLFKSGSSTSVNLLPNQDCFAFIRHFAELINLNCGEKECRPCVL